MYECEERIMRKKSMNKAVKGLSLALALSMGLGFVPGFGASEVEAAAKSGVVLHGKKTVYSAKKGTSAYIGEKKVNLDLLINGKNVAKSVKWSSSKGSVISVNKSSGVLTAKKNGRAVITAVYKNKKYKALVKVYTRPESVMVEDNGATVSEVNLTEGESKTLNVNYKISDKVAKAGGKSSTYNSYVVADNSEVVSLAKAKASSKDFTITANRAGESYVDVIGSQSSAAKANVDKKKVVARIKVVVSGNFAGRQTGASKITVTGKDLTANEKAYEVKFGSLTRSVSSVTVNSSGTEAVLNMTANLTDGDYTVTYNGKTTSFRGETAKLSKIDVPNKYLVLNGDTNAAGGTIEYMITNQFGEDLTKSVGGLTVNLSTGNNATANPAKGVIEVPSIPANLPLNSKVTLFVNKVDGTNILSNNFELTLAAKARASSVSVKGVYSTDTKQPYTLEVNNSKNNNARLLVEVKDQYGRRMKSTEGVSIYANGGLTGLGINTSSTYTDVITVDGVDYIAIPFTGTTGVKSGVVTVNFVALYGTGGNNTTQTTINISGNKQVTKFQLTPPSEVYAGETTYFNFTATNAAGDSITDYATLSSDKYGVKLSDAFSWENTANGTAKLKYDARKDNTVKSITWNAALTQIQSTAIFTIASTMYPAVFPFTVNAPALPSNLQSVSINGVLAGGTTENVLPKVKVVDNKGRELTDLSALSAYYLGVKKNSSGTRFTINATGGTNGSADANVKLFRLSDLNASSLKFAAAATAVSGYETEDFTFAIYKDATGTNVVAGSEINVKVTAADLKSLTGFELTLPSYVYAADGNVGYDEVKPVVTGKASNGSLVQLGESDIQIRDSKNLVVGSKKIVPSRGKEEAKKGDFTDVVTAIVNDGNGTEVTKNITVSAQAPTVVKVEAKTSELNLAAVNAGAFNAIKDALVITDKYTSEANGVAPSTALAKSTLQGVKFISSSSGNVKADWNNTPSMEFKGINPGDIITVQPTFASGTTGTFTFKLK